MSFRIDQINSLIQREVSDILLMMIDREHFTLATVTRVITSKDMSSAKVFVSISGNTFEAFKHWAKKRMYALQGELQKRLSLAKVPRIIFVQDETGEYVNKMEQLFKKIEKKE